MTEHFSDATKKIDYISREAAKTRIHDRAIEMALNNAGFKCDASVVLRGVSNRAKDWLDDVPSADVRPVVRGKWVRGNENRTSPIKDSYTCSVCGEKTLSGFCGNPAKTNFCPNCGADMREP